MDFLKFPSIQSFAHAHKHMVKTLAPSASFYVRPKIKLHGTNGGIQIDAKTGEVLVQSRNRIIKVGDDNAGFAAWVDTQKQKWASVKDKIDPKKNIIQVKERIVFYGEWAGPGIHSGDAVCQIPERTFFIFALRVDDVMYTEPQAINFFLPKGLENVMVLPWADVPEQLTPYLADSANAFADRASAAAEKAGEVDPFIQRVFNIKGTGEGYVYVPEKDMSVYDFRLYAFKVKCEAHREKKTKKAATVAFMVPENVDKFLESFVTEARLKQGVVEACDGEFDKKRTPDFLKWFGNDVRKESEVELAEMGFEWKQVAKSVNNRAVKWFIHNCDNVIQKEAA